jgi:uncharacterized membrane protein
MLVPIPIGLWLFSLVCDLLFVFGTGVSVWFTLSFYTMIGGVAGAVLAAIPGFIDMLSLSGSRRRIALAHMTINLLVVALYIFNVGLRIDGPQELTVPVILSAVAVALLAVSGWLGGHMVYVHGAGVDRDETPAPHATPRQGTSRGGRHARA